MSFFNKIKNSLKNPKAENNPEDNKIRNNIKENFRYLDDLINSGNDYIELDADIILGDDEESLYLGGIEINSNVTINGNDHIIDARAKTRIFNNSDNNITFKNIIFKNALTFNGYGPNGEYLKGIGGAVYNFEGNLIFDSCKFENNVAERGGGIFSLKGLIKIYNCEFSHNIANKSFGAEGAQGGAIYASNDCELTIFKSHFFSNVITEQRYLNGGGAISARGNFQCFDCVFENNSSTSVGGAIRGDNFLKNQSGSIIHNEFDYEIILENCQFIKNTAHDSGGAIYGNNFKIIDCKFIENQAKFAGAADLGRLSEIKGTNFIRNSANEYAGSISNEGNLSIKDSTFKSNVSNNYGGAISNLNGASISFENTMFLDNFSNDCEISNSGNMDLHDCEFINCCSLNNLISQCNNSDSVLNIEHCNFKSNSAIVLNILDGFSNIYAVKFSIKSESLAIYNNAKLTLNHLDFNEFNGVKIENTVIYNDNHIKSDVNLKKYIQLSEKGVFKSFHEKLPFGWKGFDYLNAEINKVSKNLKLNTNILIHDVEQEFYEGGIELSKDDFIIDGCNHIIDANHLSRIFYITGNNITLKNIKFVNGCEFKNYLFNKGGGAIYVSHGVTLNIINCEFIENESKSHASAIINNGNLKIIDSTFKKHINSAIVNHIGKVYLNNCNFESNSESAIIVRSSGELFVENSQFKFNNGNDGGAINNFGTLISLNNNFIENKANQFGGAINTSSSSKMSVTGCSFIKNEAFTGGGVDVKNGSDTEIENCCFYRNSSYRGGAIYDGADCKISNCSLKTESDKIYYLYDE